MENDVGLKPAADRGLADEKTNSLDGENKENTPLVMKLKIFFAPPIGLKIR